MLHFNQNQFTETTGTLKSYSYHPYRFNIPRKIKEKKKEREPESMTGCHQRKEGGGRGGCFYPLPLSNDISVSCTSREDILF
jgi:hypothetical protein